MRVLYKNVLESAIFFRSLNRRCDGRKTRKTESVMRKTMKKFAKMTPTHFRKTEI